VNMVLKNMFVMKRLDTSVLGVATSCSGVRNGVTNVRLHLISIKLFLSMDDLTIVKNKICLTLHQMEVLVPAKKLDGTR